MVEKTILIIDEDLELVNLIETVFKKLNYRVIFTSNSLNALEMFRDNFPDLIILNYTIDENNDFKIIKSISSLENSRMIPIIYLLNEGIEIDDDFHHENIIEIIIKPINIKLLQSKVKGYFSRLDKIKKKFDDKLEKLTQNITQALPHEFRTSISSILGFSKEINFLINDKIHLSEGDLTDLKHMNESIIQSSKYLNRLSENFILYSELQTLSLYPDKIFLIKNSIVNNPKEIIIEIIDSLTTDNNRKSDIILDSSNNNLRISFFHFYKIIYELLDNALKFSAVGEKILIRNQSNMKKSNFSIIDFGRGMTSEQIKNIEAYHQFDREIYEQQGTGLGLTISKVLVNFYDGNFEIKKNAINGITVNFDLPIY
jgi:two-component system sensor histidine kinase/response regulator